MTTATVSTTLSGTDDFFDFGVTPTADVAVNKVDKECANYFEDQDTHVKMLSRYKSERNRNLHQTQHDSTFVCPSETVFSTAGQIEVACQNCLSDSTFKQLLLLTLNSFLLSS